MPYADVVMPREGGSPKRPAFVYSYCFITRMQNKISERAHQERVLVERGYDPIMRDSGFLRQFRILDAEFVQGFAVVGYERNRVDEHLPAAARRLLLDGVFGIRPQP